MYWLDNASATGTMPPIPAVLAAVPQFFHEGGNGVAPAYPGAHWYNIVQSELLNVINEAKIEPDKFQLNQLTLAINQLIKVKTDPWVQYAYPAWNQDYLPYIRGVVVRHNNAYWVSLVNNNDAIPGADGNWQPFIFERADDDDVEAGTDPSLIITPPVLKTKMDKTIQGILNAIGPVTVPVGGGMLWFTAVPPDGWLEANGQAFNQAENPKLLAVYPSGRVPDLRGYFLRGWDHGAGVDKDAGRLIGSIQMDAMQNITGSFPADTRAANGAGVYTTGAFTEQRISRGSGDDGSNRGRLFNFDASRVVRTAAETRGINKAVMFIIKTDKSVADEGPQGPTGVIVTPSVATVNAGTAQQFSATVLPANVASQYPVTWSVSDSTLGNITQSGLYTAVAGKTGKQTVIAAISTGLYGQVAVSQYIYATGITVSPVADISAGSTSDAVITLQPATASEPLVYSSSDADIASFYNGQITANAAGSVTITATGQYSGISGSRAITVTAAVVKNNTLRVPEETIPAVPDAGGRANKVLAFDAEGNPVTLSTNHMIRGPEGEVLTALPASTSRANAELVFDVNGHPKASPFSEFTSVGSYALMTLGEGVTTGGLAPGVVVYGGSLRFAGTSTRYDGLTPPGSWMCCGAISSATERTLFRRVL